MYFEPDSIYDKIVAERARRSEATKVLPSSNMAFYLPLFGNLVHLPILFGKGNPWQSPPSRYIPHAEITEESLEKLREIRRKDAIRQYNWRHSGKDVRVGTMPLLTKEALEKPVEDERRWLTKEEMYLLSKGVRGNRDERLVRPYDRDRYSEEDDRIE